MNVLAHVAPLGVLAKTTTTKSGSSLFFLVIIGVFAAAYFLFLRPQQKKAKAAQQAQKTFEVGDEVVTIGGIHGRVLDMDGDKVTILSGGDVDTGQAPIPLVMARWGIRSKVEPPVPEVEEPEDHDDGSGEAGPAEGDGAAEHDGEEA